MHNARHATILYIGGAGDRRSNIVCGYVARCADSADVQRHYLQHSERRRALRLARDAIADGRTLILVGHSWGADTAARVALRLDGPVELLVGVDPVAKPGGRRWTRRSAQTRHVITVEGGPHIQGWGDVVKAMGVAFGRGVPAVFHKPDTDIHFRSRHDSFARMLHAEGEDGLSAADRIEGAL